KPMVVTLPLVLLLLDIWPLKRVVLSTDRLQSWRGPLLEKLPLLAMSIAFGIVTIFTQVGAGAVPGLETLSVPARLSHALIGYVVYLGNVFWPLHLAAYYPPLPVSWPLASASALLLATMTAATIYFRGQPFLLVGWFWYLITLAPAIGLIQSGNQGMG